MKKVQLGQLKDKDKENALNEIRILASIDDPFIIGYKVLISLIYSKKGSFSWWVII